MKFSLFLKSTRDEHTHWTVKFITLVLLLDPILKTYGTDSISVSNIFQSLAIFIFFLFLLPKYGGLNKAIKRIPKSILGYHIYYILAFVFINYSINFGSLRILLLHIIFFSVINFKTLIKTYQNLAVIFILFFYLQEFTYHTTGIRVLGFIPGLPIRITEDASSYLEGISLATRSSSLFSEPAHFVQWLFPLLCIRLFSNEYRDFKRAIIILLTILYTKSGNGMFGIGIIGIAFCYVRMIKSKNTVHKIAGAIISIASVFFLVWFSNSDAGKEVFDRSDTLSLQNNLDLGRASSSFMRIYRGYYIYGDYNLAEKIFGNVGTEDFKMHVSRSGMSMYFRDNDTYMNTVHRILIHTGIIGIIFFIGIIRNFWKNNYLEAKVMLLVWIMLSFISSCLFGGYTDIYFIMIYLLKKTQGNINH